MNKPDRTRVSDDLLERLIAFRRDLHRHPELSGDEERTAARIVDQLERLGLPHQAGIGGHGIVATVPGTGDGPAVALRGDMDALPVHEQTGLDFASEVEGVMHACGHDGHSAILLGAAELLAAGEPPAGPVRLLWQPAEETASGAPAMIADGALEGVGMIFGGHLDRHYAPGVVVASEGAVNASTDQFTVHVRGRQGHGARPHEAVDAVVVGSLLVTALQTIVSREVDPAHPSVLSVGSFQAGSAPNVIAGRARLQGTIRSQDPAVRAHLHRSLIRIARSVGELHGAEVEVELEPHTPPLINEGAPLELARAAIDEVGAERVDHLHTANMGGEDFACFLEHVPGCYVRIGAQVEGREGFPAHSSQFDFDERALATGAAWMTAVARRAARHLADGA